jgi:antitoxin CptB
LSDVNLSSNGLDPRRRRVLFRARHRGMREMDILMGRFADAELPTLTEAELDDFERLMDVPDRDVLAWLMGRAMAPANYDTSVLRRLRAFHAHARPINL